jgi:hypothetical protein
LGVRLLPAQTPLDLPEVDTGPGRALLALGHRDDPAAVLLGEDRRQLR